MPKTAGNALAKRTASKTGADQLVVVGASAGGVDALVVLVQSLPADLPAPIVIAQHLAPDRPSQLAEILERHSALPVRSVESHEPLSAGTIYVVPANRDVTITDHEVKVSPDGGGKRRPLPSVDLLLSSAAATFGDGVIAVVLSGSGSDGAAGAHKVKEAGGTIIIQDPATAAFPSMPRALAPPLVDAAVPLERIGPLLTEFLTMNSSAVGSGENADLSALLERLRTRRGIDFSAYKTPTIERRLLRRMATVGVSSVGDYLDIIDRDRDEEQQLIAHFLIKVTRFFRDSALFAILRENIIPELVNAARVNNRELRIWSAGCATGEEAYSLALLVAQQLGEKADASMVRIFATDLDETALAFARRGLFPAAALEDTDPGLVSRYFIERDGSYEVRKQVRSLIVFGNHDLAQRPPFPHIDLVLCRNVLIYFTPELQQRAFELFAYSLRDNGYLVLGKSETPRPANGVFATVDGRQKIYRRQGPRTALPPSHLRAVQNAPGLRDVRVSRMHQLRETEMTRASEMEQAAEPQAANLLGRLPIGIAVVNQSYDALLINTAARELLGVHGVAIGQDLVHLVRQDLAVSLREVIDPAFKGHSFELREKIIRIESASGEERYISLRAAPDETRPDETIETVMVLVQDVTDLAAARDHSVTATARGNKLEEANRELLAANRELTTALDSLRAQGDDLRLATAAAQVWAEEIETLNEELQSSNEELETLHEEAQATVEELNVANEELEARSAEMKELAAMSAAEGARLAAVLAGMGDAVVVVDESGKIVLTNAAYDTLLEVLGGSLIPADEYGFPYPEEDTPRRRASRGEEFRQDFTARAPDGTRYWFDATGRPLAPDEAGEGVVVIRDITDRNVRRLQEEFLQWAGHELRTPLAALQSFLQLAMRSVEDGSDSELREHLASALEQSRRQATLIDELLDASRLRTGRIMLRTEPLDLVPLVRHVCQVAQVLAKGQTIDMDSEEDSLIIAGDPARFEQVLLNLLLNAISYAPGTDRIAVRLRRHGDNVELSVHDFGPGIQPGQLEAIFERFSRPEPVLRSGTSGLGLGLFIAREIVQAHRGTIDVQSTPGEGATFTISIPLMPDAQELC